MLLCWKLQSHKRPIEFSIESVSYCSDDSAKSSVIHQTYYFQTRTYFVLFLFTTVLIVPCEGRQSCFRKIAHFLCQNIWFLLTFYLKIFFSSSLHKWKNVVCKAVTWFAICICNELWKHSNPETLMQNLKITLKIYLWWDLSFMKTMKYCVAKNVIMSTIQNENASKLTCSTTYLWIV